MDNNNPDIPPLSLAFLKQVKTPLKQIDLYYKYLNQLRRKIHPKNEAFPQPHEYYFTIKTGKEISKIFVQEFIPPKMEMILIAQHGNSIQSDLFYPLADELYFRNIGLIVMDNRGHGRSFNPNRGDLCHPERIFPLYDVLLVKYKVPAFILGESLGSPIITKYMKSRLKNRDKTEYFKLFRYLKGVILQVPPMRLIFEKKIPLKHSFFRKLIKIFLIGLLRIAQVISLGKHVIPFIANPNPRYYREFSYGVDRIDPIRAPKTKIRHFISVVKLIIDFPKDLKHLRLPTLILEGENDSILDFRGAFEIYKKIPTLQKKVIIYRGADHSLYNSPYSAKIYKDIPEWMEQIEKITTIER